MDALLAQSKRDSERPHVGKVKFEVREQTEAVSANEDPRGWLFSGRPPAPDPADERPEEVVKPTFRVQEDNGTEGEDPRGWLFSGRPDAPQPTAIEPPSPASQDDSRQDSPASAQSQKQKQESSTKKDVPNAARIPAPVAKLALVKKSKKRKKSGAQPAASEIIHDPAGESLDNEAAAPPAPPLAPARASEENNSNPGDRAGPNEDVESDLAAQNAGRAQIEDSDPTLEVVTPSSDGDNDLEALSAAISVQLGAPSQQQLSKTAGRQALIISAVFLLGALIASYYLYNRGVFDVFADQGTVASTGRISRKIVAYRKPIAAPNKTSAAAGKQPAAAEKKVKPDSTGQSKVSQPASEVAPAVPPEEVVTEIDEMTPEQQAMSEDARFKDARYLRARGFRAIRQEKLDKAEKSFRQSLQLYPDSSVSLRGLGETLMLKGEKARARAWLGRALRRNPADKEAQSLLDELEKN